MIDFLNSAQPVKLNTDAISIGANNRLCPLSTEVEPTVYLKGEFLGLTVVAVLLQVTDAEFFQRKSSLSTKQQRVQLCFVKHKTFSDSLTKSILCNISVFSTLY